MDLQPLTDIKISFSLDLGNESIEFYPFPFYLYINFDRQTGNFLPLLLLPLSV